MTSTKPLYNPSTKMPVVEVPVYVTIVPGDASVGTLYGRFVSASGMTLKSLQASVNGTPPEGSYLEFSMRVNGVAELPPLQIAADENHASVNLLVEKTLVAGDVVDFICSAVGSVYPGSWIELRICAEVEMLFT